jgi:signal transduction histidine kinase/CheY-like chemotaxis protein
VEQKQQRTQSAILRLLGITALFVAATAGLVSFKVDMWPWELAWLDGRALSSVVQAVLHESRYEIAALGIVALNFLWALIRLESATTESEASMDVRDLPSHALVDMDMVDNVEGSAGDPFDMDIEIDQISTGRTLERDKNSVNQLQIATAELSRMKKELVSCRQQLDAATKAKSQFLNNMSHELRTPMNGIMGMTELLLKGELPPRERRFASSVATSADSLLSIINDLLDFSKIEAGTLYLERARFSVRNCVEDVCSSLADSAHVKGIELICYIDDEMPAQVDGDANRIRQILHNLISNAIAFTSAGEVVVRITRLEDVDKQLVLQCDVQDTGAGIAPELQATMFEAFTQADTSNTRRHGGLGMGLAIAQQLISKMGGKISFRSRIGEGTRFTFTMKLDSVADAEQEVSRQRSLHGARALVVDDNETNRTILFHQLSSWGIVTDTVESGASAISLLHAAVDSNRPYDMLVLDLHMPDMDGVELARAIAADPEIANIKSLMLTSAVLELDSEELSAIGIDKYISKPARQSLLHDSLEALMPHVAGSLSAGGSVNSVEQLLPINATVLLAEDNVVNQDVAINMLEQLGCQVKMVSDGRGAVELCRKMQFDIIFMDCQMPIMDGYEATTSIKGSNGINASTPIVALTANAMEGDRERCLSHGMDDYLSKPVRQAQLHELLGKWVSKKGERPAALSPRDTDQKATVVSVSDRVITASFDRHPSTLEPSQSMPVNRVSGSSNLISLPSPVERTLDYNLGADKPTDLAAGSSLINEKAINNIRGLQRPGKEDLLSKVAQVYFDKTPELIEQMVVAAEAGDLDGVKASAHSLKSSSAYLGADGLSEKCRHIENATASGDAASIVKLSHAIASEYDAVVEQLSGILGKAA